VSGPRVPAIAVELLGALPAPRVASYARFRDAEGGVIDDGIALRFAAPASYTGEDVLELQGHGAPVLLRLLLDRVCALGARPARAGEFTERAYLNGKLDLAQAEAVADLIAAGSEAAARAARRSLDGVFSRRADQVFDALADLRVHVEAAIDFPEEGIDFLIDPVLAERMRTVQALLAALLEESERGRRLVDGLHVVIVGAPNAGKSSLLNALSGSERAIVTEVPGTTRDLLREVVRIDGIELTLVDTAGLRRAGDAIEVEGMRRARLELAHADLALAVLDDSGDPQAAAQALAGELAGVPCVLWLHSKCDRSGASAHAEQRDDGVHLWLSAHSGAGLDALRRALQEAAGSGEGASGAFSARVRHVEALRRTAAHVDAARARLDIDRAGELAAEELRLAQQALGELTGVFDSDALLGRIFSAFCIGK
jgi:tRNA modification GTPase